MSETKQIFPAFVAAQSQIGTAIKDSKNPHLKNNYADFSSVWQAIQPSLVNNNLAVIQSVKETPGFATVETTLIHASGESLNMGTVTFKVEEPKGINLAQATGLAITYARRYGLSSAFCVCTEDDDGNMGGNPRQYEQPRSVVAPPAPKQSKEDRAINAVCEWLREMFGDNKDNAVAWLATQGYEGFEQFYAAPYPAITKVYRAAESAIAEYRQPPPAFNRPARLQPTTGPLESDPFKNMAPGDPTMFAGETQRVR